MEGIYLKRLYLVKSACKPTKLFTFFVCCIDPKIKFDVAERIRLIEGLMHIKSVEAQIPPIDRGVELGESGASSGVVLVSCPWVKIASP